MAWTNTRQLIKNALTQLVELLESLLLANLETLSLGRSKLIMLRVARHISIVNRRKSPDMLIELLNRFLYSTYSCWRGSPTNRSEEVGSRARGRILPLAGQTELKSPSPTI